MRSRLVLVLLCATWLGAPARSATAQEVLDMSVCEPATRARLQWLVERLDARERHGDLWWRGWTGFYGIGAVVQGVQAGLEDDRGERADLIVSGVKAVAGVTRLYFSRPTARLGADPLRTAPIADESECRARVAEGEALLERAAHESARRWGWKAHLFNVALNMAGAVVVTEGFDEDDGWTSAAIGIGVGEAMIWTHPWTGGSDLAEYDARFSRRVSWSVVPHGRGFRVLARF